MHEMRKYKFTKHQRLLKKQEFDAVFDIKNSVSDQNIIIYLKNNLLQYNRLGIVIGKKVANAVWRNRFKRIVREAFRKSVFETQCCFDLIVLPRKPLNTKLRSTDIEQSLCFLVSKLNNRGKLNE